MPGAPSSFLLLANYIRPFFPFCFLYFQPNIGSFYLPFTVFLSTLCPDSPPHPTVGWEPWRHGICEERATRALLGTSATLLVTGALLVVTRSY